MQDTGQLGDQWQRADRLFDRLFRRGKVYTTANLKWLARREGFTLVQRPKRIVLTHDRHPTVEFVPYQANGSGS